MSEFVHLHLHTEYSLLDGFCRMGPLMTRAKERGMTALAMTDHGYLYGAVEFYKAARKAEIKPIFGVEAYLAPGRRDQKTGRMDNAYYHVLLLAKDMEGYRNLMSILSIASIEGFYYRPRADRETLARFSKGLIATSGCLRGEIPCALAKNDYEGAKKIAQDYIDMFGRDSFYIELMDHNIAEQAPINTDLIKLATDMGLPLVATNDVHYLEPGDAVPHDVLLCIQMGKTLEDNNRMKFGSDQFYLKTADEMAQVFRHYPQALKNTMRIAEMCNVELDLKSYHLPAFPIDQEKFPEWTEDQLLEHICRENMPRCYGENPSQEVLDRLDYELGVIKQMGFPAYFLIVADFIQWAKDHDIPVGPGRGSAAGSIVSYLTSITELDPMKFSLIFERFLNPGRKEMPDVDTDFCVERRGEVIEYVRQKYGDDRVCQIVTFGRLKARASIRDVGRVLNFPLGFVDKVAKMVPAGPKVTLKSALDESQEFAKLYNENPDARKIIDLARALEGVPRNASIHAAGVIIAKNPLTELVPLQKMNDKDIVAQFEMGPVGEIGLLKMDFLGLRNLTVIKHCLGIIKQRHGRDIDMLKLPEDDAAVFELLQAADTTGVFQFESAGMRRYLRQLKPDRFADIVAMVALYRPGPIQGGMVEKYIDRRHGREEIDYPHPWLEPILGETYGIILYQEQVMQIANRLASYTMPMADELRKAMGKKKADLMEKHRQIFADGSVNNGIKRELAVYIFDLMETFAGYGFNKSHSAAYGIVTYHTAYLKAHYPHEYMCALMTSVMDKIDKVSFFVAEARSAGIPVLPPHVNKSDVMFTVEDLPSAGEDTPRLARAGIRFGMAAIRNVGVAAIEAVQRARQAEGEFKSLYEFCRRVDLTQVNKRVIESLIKAGAMDCFGATRATLLANLDPCLDSAQRAQREASTGQISLFGDLESTDEESAGISTLEQPEFEQPVLLSMEKEMLGLYLSDSPLSEFDELLGCGVFTPINKFAEVGAGNRVMLAGVVVNMRKITTKTGQSMAFLQLEDTGGSVEVTTLPRVYDKCVVHLNGDAMLAVKGLLETRLGGREEEDEDAPSEELKILADEVVPLEGLTPQEARRILEAPLEQRPSKWPRRDKPANEPPRSTYKPPPGSSATEDWASRADDRLEGEGGAAPPVPQVPVPAGMASEEPADAAVAPARVPAAPRAAQARPRPKPPAPKAAPPPKATPAPLPPPPPSPAWAEEEDLPPWESLPAAVAAAPATVAVSAPPLHIRIGIEQRQHTAELRVLLQRHAGEQSVYLHYDSGGRTTIIAAGDEMSVAVTPALQQALDQLLGTSSNWV